MKIELQLCLFAHSLSSVQETVYFAAELCTQTQSEDRIITLLQEIRGTLIYELQTAQMSLFSS